MRQVRDFRATLDTTRASSAASRSRHTQWRGPLARTEKVPAIDSTLPSVSKAIPIQDGSVSNEQPMTLRPYHENAQVGEHAQGSPASRPPRSYRAKARLGELEPHSIQAITSNPLNYPSQLYGADAHTGSDPSRRGPRAAAPGVVSSPSQSHAADAYTGSELKRRGIQASVRNAAGILQPHAANAHTEPVLEHQDPRVATSISGSLPPQSHAAMAPAGYGADAQAGYSVDAHTGPDPSRRGPHAAAPSAVCLPAKTYGVNAPVGLERKGMQVAVQNAAGLSQRHVADAANAANTANVANAQSALEPRDLGVATSPAAGLPLQSEGANVHFGDLRAEGTQVAAPRTMADRPADIVDVR